MYTVWLFGTQTKHVTLYEAGRKLYQNQQWCNGENAQCIDEFGNDVTDLAWYEYGQYPIGSL